MSTKIPFKVYSFNTSDTRIDQFLSYSKYQNMGILHLNTYNSNVASLSISSSSKFSHNTTGTPTTTTTHEYLKPFLPASNNYKRLSCSRGGKLTTMRAATEKSEVTPITSTESEVIDESEVEPPSIDFTFVSSVLFPDGTPDIQIRSACGGQKLRDIMLDSNIELYGPYARFLLNCGGGGTCGTCMVEVIEGKELLSLRTDKEKEILKRKPKTWRLACQTIVGKQDSRGEIAIQQLPEWKVHQWTYDKDEAAAAAAELE